MPLPILVDEMLDACRPHARELGCVDELESVLALLDDPGSAHQLRLAEKSGRLPGLVEALAGEF